MTLSSLRWQQMLALAGGLTLIGVALYFLFRALLSDLSLWQEKRKPLLDAQALPNGGAGLVQTDAQGNPLLNSKGELSLYDPTPLAQAFFAYFDSHFSSCETSQALYQELYQLDSNDKFAAVIQAFDQLYQAKSGQDFRRYLAGDAYYFCTDVSWRERVKTKLDLLGR